MGVSLKVESKITSKTATAVKVTVSVFAVSNYGSFNNNAQRGTVYIDGKSYDFTSTYKSNATTKVAEKSRSIERTTKTFKINTSAVFKTGTSSGTVKNSDTVSIPALESYTIKYNAGKGASNVPGNQTKWYGKNLRLSTTKPKKDQYDFKGWSLTSGGTKAYDPGDYYKANRSDILYALWQPQQITITGKSGLNQNITTNYSHELGKVNLSNLTYTKVTGYKFVGWTTIADSNEPKYPPNATITVTKNITLYGCYQSTTRSNYVTPKISITEGYRCNSTGEPNFSGIYYKLVFEWARGQKFQYSPDTDVGFYIPDDDDAALNMGHILINNELITDTSDSLQIKQITNGFYYSDNNSHEGIAYKGDTESTFSTYAESGEISVILGPATDEDEGFDVSKTYTITIEWYDLTNENGQYIVYDGDDETSYDCNFIVSSSTNVDKSGYLMHFSNDGQGMALFGIAENPGLTIYNHALENWSYPIGSVYISSSNINPHETLGFGTWELFDKHFKNQGFDISKQLSRGQSSNSHYYVYAYNNTNTDNRLVGTALFHETFVTIRLKYTNGYAWDGSGATGTDHGSGDDTRDIIWFQSNVVGINSTHTPWTSYQRIGFTDGGNATILHSLSTTAPQITLSTVDILNVNGTHTLAQNSHCFVEFPIHVTNFNARLDNFCDKFYWRRIS